MSSFHTTFLYLYLGMKLHQFMTHIHGTGGLLTYASVDHMILTIIPVMKTPFHIYTVMSPEVMTTLYIIGIGLNRLSREEVLINPSFGWMETPPSILYHLLSYNMVMINIRSLLVTPPI